MLVRIKARQVVVNNYERVIDITKEEYKKIWLNHPEPFTKESDIWSYNLLKFAEKYIGKAHPGNNYQEVANMENISLEPTTGV
jgi:hypothetical protein